MSDDRFSPPQQSSHPPYFVEPFPLRDAEDPPPTRPRRKRKRWGRWLGLGLAIVAIVAGMVAAPWDADRRQAYADQWIVWTEPPTTRIERLADELALTETGRRIFFASRPQIDAASDFQQHCPLEGDVVLGCYGGKRIYVYEVTDERLSGTIEATAAHELLHAFYDRLSPERAARIDQLVASHVDALPADDANRTVVEGYSQAQRADEWHSRLGIGYADLPPALEAHYAEVFLDRARIVAFTTGATAELDDYSARIDRLSAELEAASEDLATRSAAYDAGITRLNADIEDFNRRADSGRFTSREAFDAERDALLTRQDALEADRVRLNGDVAAYNAKLAELTSLDAERAELFAQLDSRSAP